MRLHFEKTVIINSDSGHVWNVLTKPGLMKQWMGDEALEIEIKTDWIVSHPFIVRGLHYLQFENKGTVLRFEQNKTLQYTHLSSLSGLEDRPGNYAAIQFELKPLPHQTELKLCIENFPTDVIYKHLCFYWSTTIEKVKEFAELVN